MTFSLIWYQLDTMLGKRTFSAIVGVGIFAGVFQCAFASPVVEFISPDYYVAPGAPFYNPPPLPPDSTLGSAGGYIALTGWQPFVMSVPYSEAQLTSPPTTFNYTGTSFPTGSYSTGYNDTLPSAKFYGGAVATGTYGLSNVATGNNAGASGYRISTSGTTADTILAATIGGETQPISEVTLAVLTMWKQEDFVSMSTEDVTLTANSLFKFNIRAGASNDYVDARLVIKQNDNYYISAVLAPTAYSAGVTATTSGTVTKTVEQSNVVGLEWFDYNPFANVVFSPGGTAVTPDFSDIQALGLYAYAFSNHTANKTVGVTINTIIFDPAPIPEPGSLVLVGAGLLCAWAWLKKPRAKI